MKNSIPKTSESLSIFDKSYAWAQLNFKLQNIIHNSQLSDKHQAEIETLGFKGDLPKNREALHNKKCFFSVEKTGNRIASLAIKEVGLNISLLEWAEEGIKHAYEETTQKEPNPLLEESLFKSLEILSIFKP